MSKTINKPTIFVDIRSNLPRVGKTTLAALIADALVVPLRCSPNLKVKVVSAEGDFPDRYQNIRTADGDFKPVNDLLVVIVDNNTPLEPGPTPAAYTYDIGSAGRAHEVQFETPTSDAVTPRTEGQRLAEIVRATARDMALPFAQVEMLYAAVTKNENWPK